MKKYLLQPYKGRNTRHTCPQCGHKHEFILYIDANTGQPLDMRVGRCNREDKCGYHYKPSQFFRGRGDLQPITILPSRPKITTHFDTIDKQYFESLYGKQSNHARWLVHLFGNDRVDFMMCEYMLGCLPDGSVIFWQRDIKGKLRTGKIIQYNPNTGRNTGKFNWMHRKIGKPDFALKQCLYGEHLLKVYPDKRVLLVESYKNTSAVACLTKHFVCLSTDCKGGFNAEKCTSLKGRDVITLPDCGAYTDWKRTAGYIARDVGCTIHTSDFLERLATDEQKSQGYDIADWIEEQIKAGRELADIEKQLITNLCAPQQP